MILLLSGQEKNSEFMGLRRFLRLWSLWGVSGNVLPRTEYTPPFYWNLGKQNWKSKSCSWGPWTIAVSWQRESSYLKKRLTSFWENHSKERDLSLKKKKKNIKYALHLKADFLFLSGLNSFTEGIRFKQLKFLEQRPLKMHVVYFDFSPVSGNFKVLKLICEHHFQE